MPYPRATSIRDKNSLNPILFTDVTVTVSYGNGGLQFHDAEGFKRRQAQWTCCLKTPGIQPQRKTTKAKTPQAKISW